jgi:hypothetical protein
VGLSEVVSTTTMRAAVPLVSADLALLRRQILRQGYCAIPRVFSDALLERLRAEARARLPHAEPVSSDGYEIGSDGLLYPPRRQHSASGPALRSVHAEREVVALTRLLTGRLMVPSPTAAYWFYESDGFIGLHRDVGDCDFVLLIGALGAPEPITVYPQLAQRTTEELLNIATEEGGLRLAGEELSIPEDGAAALWGSAVPHERLPGRRRDTVGVATLCYRSVV